MIVIWRRSSPFPASFNKTLNFTRNNHSGIHIVILPETAKWNRCFPSVAISQEHYNVETLLIAFRQTSHIQLERHVCSWCITLHSVANEHTWLIIGFQPLPVCFSKPVAQVQGLVFLRPLWVYSHESCLVHYSLCARGALLCHYENNFRSSWSSFWSSQFQFSSFFLFVFVFFVVFPHFSSHISFPLLIFIPSNFVY